MGVDLPLLTNDIALPHLSRINCRRARATPKQRSHFNDSRCYDSNAELTVSIDVSRELPLAS